MFWNFKLMAAFAVVIVLTVSQCNANFQEFRASLMPRKTVATSYLTLERYSHMRCVEKCYAEGKQGRCTIAAFNKATRSCRLSMDSQCDILDTSDDSSGVYTFQHVTQGSLYDYSTMSSSNITHFLINHVNKLRLRTKCVCAVIKTRYTKPSFTFNCD